MIYLLYVSCAFEVLAFIAALVAFRYHDWIFRLFFLDLCAVVINETIGFFPMPHTGIPQMVRFGCLNIYFLIEMWIISLAGFRLITNSILRYFLKAFLAIFSGLWLYLFVKEGLAGLLIPAVMTGDILGAIIFLAVIINMMGTKDMPGQPLFWISLGYLIFYCCNIPYFGLLHYVYTLDQVLLSELRGLLFVINIVHYGLTAYSFYLLKKQQTAIPAVHA